MKTLSTSEAEIENACNEGNSRWVRAEVAQDLYDALVECNNLLLPDYGDYELEEKVYNAIEAAQR